MKQLNGRQTPVPGFGGKYGLLSATTAMPCPSFSLPAVMTCPGRSKDKDSVCNTCYARGGTYRYKAPADCQAARLVWTRKALKTAAGRVAWTRAMVDAVIKTQYPEFRWHDSGDVFNATYGKMVLMVVRGTPQITHWIPTRSWVRPAILRVLTTINLEGNAVVRPSALLMDEPAPCVSGLAAGTTVYTEKPVDGEYACPKTAAGLASCEEAGCRTCFLSPARKVGYKFHPPNGGVEAGDRIRKDRLAIINQEKP